MLCKLNAEELKRYIEKQLYNSFAGEILPIPPIPISSIMVAMNRLEYACSKLKTQYYNKTGEVCFYLQHTVQQAVFLYYLSHDLYENDMEELASYVYYLNKILHSVEWFYAIDLPDVFFAEHPMSSVLGRAEYSNRFFVYQGTTVGGNRQGDKIFYPKIGENVIMYANSTILGNSKIGKNVIVSAGTYIKDENIPDNCLVFGQSPNIVIKKRSIEDIRKMNPVWIYE